MKTFFFLNNHDGIAMIVQLVRNSGIQRAHYPTGFPLDNYK